MSGGRPPRVSFSSSSTATASSRGDGRLFSPGRRGLLPTLAGLSGVAIACVAATESSRPAGFVLAAESTPSSALSAVVEDEEEDEKENAELVAVAHELRRSLTPPHQSLFRVVCILVYEDSAGNLHRITGEHVFHAKCVYVVHSMYVFMHSVGGLQSAPFSFRCHAITHRERFSVIVPSRPTNTCAYVARTYVQNPCSDILCHITVHCVSFTCGCPPTLCVGWWRLSNCCRRSTRQPHRHERRGQYDRGLHLRRARGHVQAPRGERLRARDQGCGGDGQPRPLGSR